MTSDTTALSHSSHSQNSKAKGKSPKSPQPSPPGDARNVGALRKRPSIIGNAKSIKKDQKASKSIKRVMRCHELSQLASPAECGMLRFAVDVGGMTRESRIQLFGALSRSTITVLLRIRWACHCFNPAQAAALYS